MGEITTDAAQIFRDLESPTNPILGEHEPIKSEIRGLFALVDTTIEDLAQVVSDAQIAGRKAYLTWAALSAVTLDPNTIAEVPPSDAGTHTDPIAGGTVNNSGVYMQVVGPPTTGWRRIGDYAATQIASSAEVRAGTVSNKVVAPDTLKTELDFRRHGIQAQVWSMLNQLPSLAKPLMVIYVDDDRIWVIGRPHDGAYRDGYVRRYDDVFAAEMRQLSGTYHAAGNPIWVMCSFWSRFAGVWVPHANYTWNDLVGSATFDTGTTASTNEPVWGVGKLTDTAATINAAGFSGPYHGNIAATGQTQMLVEGGVKDGVTIPAATDVRTTFKPGDVITCTRFDFSSVWNYLTPDGSIAGAMNTLHRFDPLNSTQLLHNGAIVFGGAGFHATIAYAGQFAQRIANRVQARSTAGVAGAVQTVGLGAGASINLGQAARATTWHTDHVGHAFDFDIQASYVPFRKNGAQAPYTLAMFGLDNATGLKIYIPIFQGSLDLDVVTGDSFGNYNIYNAVRANGA